MNFTDVGRLAADPEIKYFESGRSKTTFTLAIDSAERDDNGKPKTVWFNCEAWANSEGKGVGQTIANYCEKGSQILVRGAIKQEEWIEKDTGKKRREIKLNVSEVKLLGKRQQSEAQPQEDPANEADDPKPEPKAKSKAKTSPNPYASTASKGKAMAYAGGVDAPPETDDIPF